MDYFCSWRQGENLGEWIPECRPRMEWTFAVEDGPDDAGMKWCPICGCPVAVIETIPGGGEE